MAKRVDYQNPLDNLEEVYEKRNEQIRAWAKADQELADALIGVPSDITTFDDWDVLEEDLEDIEVEPVEPEPVVEPEAAAEPEEEPEADPEPEPEVQETVKEEPKEEPKKAPAKKAAAAPKEASSKA
jgi:outer membrane biosynthesis protein TonB